MPGLPTAAFARELRSLDDTELAAFVAALWAARGFETAVEGATVVAERPSGVDRERIRCGARAAAVDPDAIDTVLDVTKAGASATPREVRVLRPADLREMLLYAVDRETADQLLRTHFGRPLTAVPDETAGRLRMPGVPSRQVIGVVLLAVLAVGVAIGASGGTPSLGESNQSVPLPLDQTVTATSVPLVDARESRFQGGGNLFRYPPGLGPSGVTDTEALAAAHRTGVAGSSWTLRVVHNGSLDLVHPFRRWIVAEQVVVRETHARYRFRVTGFERVSNGSIATVTYADYGDGVANYRRLIGLHGSAFRRTQLPTDRPPGLFATLSAAYVQRYLATTESRVEPIKVHNTTRQRVVATGTPMAMARTVSNYTAVAVVGRQGLVYNLSVQYTLLERRPDPTPNGIATPYQPADVVPTEPVGTVRFEMVLRDVDSTTLSAPSWHPRALVATNGTTLPPWPNDPAV